MFCLCLVSSFFRGDWSGALYHDRFSAMTLDIEEALMAGEESVKAVMSAVRDAVSVCHLPCTARGGFVCIFCYGCFATPLL